MCCTHETFQLEVNRSFILLDLLCLSSLRSLSFSLSLCMCVCVYNFPSISNIIHFGYVRIWFGFQCTSAGCVSALLFIQHRSALIKTESYIGSALIALFSNRLDKVNCKLISSFVHSNRMRCSLHSPGMWQRRSFMLSTQTRGNGSFNWNIASCWRNLNVVEYEWRILEIGSINSKPDAYLNCPQNA